MLRLTKIVGTIFGTGSSAATLPVSMNCLEQVATVPLKFFCKGCVSEQIIEFVHHSAGLPH